MVHIIGDKSKSEMNLGLMGQDDEELYDEDPEFSDEFEPGLWLIHQHHDIRMDPTVDYKKDLGTRMDNANIGVLTHTFGCWRIYVNWSTEWAQKIPPHHMAVEFGAGHTGGMRSKRASTEWRLVGIISPYMTMRTCWSCRRGNPIIDGRFNEDGYWVRADPDKIEAAVVAGNVTPEEAAVFPDKIPAVFPAHACPAVGCGEYDWFGDMQFGATARREDFQRDAAESLALVTGMDNLATDMRMTHDPTGQGAGFARTTV